MTAVQEVAFDLVVATRGRTAELHELLSSLERQTHRVFRVLLADQNGDDRLAEVVATHRGLDIEHVPSPPGLSRARNAALGRVTGEVAGFPDDDCTYPDDLLARVAERFAAEPTLDGVTGRTADRDGSSSPRWPTEPGSVEPDNVWHRCNSASLFLRRETLALAGGFDERLGLGSGTAWSSGEEIDLVVRALRRGASLDYDPSLTVWHPSRRLSAPDRRRVGRRDGASVGYVLGKHRYGPRMLARMFVRPVGGAVLGLARLDPDTARFNLATLRGRLEGYPAGRRARSSANNSA